MKRFVARQGDVLIERTTTRAIKGTRATRVGGRLILAEGEATGHAHAISDADVEMFITEQEAYLVVEREATVVHEEHASIALAPGTYRVSRQREYFPDSIRNVAD